MKKFIIGILFVLGLIFNGGHVMAAELHKATFAGGCFWCLEPSFDELEGVKRTTVGYTGGHLEDPTYQDIGTGQTGHYEAIEVAYDPDVISYQKLLDQFFRNIDPTDPDGQFADRGPQYRTAVFYHDDAQQQEAKAFIKQLDDSGKFDQPVVTKVIEAAKFYPAEDYHQEYYKKSSTHYNMYKVGSGRAGYIKETWGDKK